MLKLLNKNILRKFQKNICLFRFLTLNEIKYFLEFGEVEKFIKDEKIITQNETGDLFYIILSGEVGVYKYKDNKYRLLKKISTGNIFGEISALTGLKRTATVVSHTKTITIKLNSKNFQKIEEEKPKLIMKVYKAFMQFIIKRYVTLN